MQKKATDNNFSFLKDERALYEIRKHKWIESKKKGAEIGFATAALDWINRYGKAWKNENIDKVRREDVFIEKRRFRRFKFNRPVFIKKDNEWVQTYPKDISIISLSCSSDTHLPKQSKLYIRINFSDDLSKHEDNLICSAARVIRSNALDSKGDRRNYNFVLSFEKDIRDFLRDNSRLLIGTGV